MFKSSDHSFKQMCLVINEELLIGEETNIQEEER